MKKKLIASITCLSMLLIMLLSSTMAWFTDQKGAQSTMVVGKISIKQNAPTKGQTAVLPNVSVPYQVTVENTGNQPAYLRTIFAFEDGDIDGTHSALEMIDLWKKVSETESKAANIVIPGMAPNSGNKIQFTATEDGKPTVYTVGYYLHEVPLEVGQDVTIMDSFMLDSLAGNDWHKAVGEKYDILVLSQACQVAGMTGTNEDALNTSFGKITSVKCASWFGTMLDKDTQAYISTAEDLQEALNNGQTDITLMADIEVTESIVIPAPTMRSVSDAVVIDLNRKTMKSEKGTVIYNEGNLVLTGKGKIESTAQAYAIRVQQGNMLIDSADIEVVSAFGAVSIFNGADVTINGGSYYAAGIDGKTSHCVYVGGGTLTVNGGTFDSGYSSEGIDTICGSSAANITLNGGTFYASELGESFFLKNVIVKGGTYQYAPTGVAAGYTALKTGDKTWVVMPEGTEFVTDGLYKNGNTYYIENANGLKYFSAKALTGNDGNAESVVIELQADINLAGADFSAIIAQRGDTLTFKGNGHTISNVKIVSGAGDNTTGQASMFYAFPNSTLNVSDLILKDITVTSDADASGYAAAVIGYCEGAAVLNNVDVVNATINGVKSSGMLVGHLSGSLTATDCDLTGTVTLVDFAEEANGHYAGKYIGTLAGPATLTNCTVDSTVSGNLNAANIGDIYGRKTVAGSVKLITAYVENNVTYHSDAISGDVLLYLVSEDYAENTLTIPEGVTAIGNYAFAYNDNVKTVVLASTIRDLGRGFDSSNVEKVVLNEGLEVISSRAFRATPNLKEVVISSSVKEIADNAFQKSGIKEIVIPANVETIGETAFGASKIETVTFKGNIAIQGYAFRGCPNLKTVRMDGDNVTFIASTLNGRNSMWFCNGESNNPNTSNINFYVVNETVAERVKVAMGAEAANTPVYVNSVLYEG